MDMRPTIAVIPSSMAMKNTKSTNTAATGPDQDRQTDSAEKESVPKMRTTPSSTASKSAASAATPKYSGTMGAPPDNDDLPHLSLVGSYAATVTLTMPVTHGLNGTVAAIALRRFVDALAQSHILRSEPQQASYRWVGRSPGANDVPRHLVLSVAVAPWEVGNLFRCEGCPPEAKD